jgi:sulfur transfer complex TusBCD TusB component (DsrH family)
MSDRLSYAEFHNALRIMLNLDRSDLVQAGVLDAQDERGWARLRDDPFRWFIRAEDARAERFWRLIQRRQPMADRRPDPRPRSPYALGMQTLRDR